MNHIQNCGEIAAHFGGEHWTEALRDRIHPHPLTEKTMTKEKQPERWKPVVGYEGIYEVSDLGRVRSLSRKVDYSRFGKVAVSRLRKKNAGTRLLFVLPP